MALYLTRADDLDLTIACALDTGCDHVAEVDALALIAHERDETGRVVSLRYDCPSCGAAMFAPRHDVASVARLFADPALAYCRRLWHRANREIHPDQALREHPDHPWLRGPIPPGDHTRNLATVWEALDAAGWPDAVPADRERRHADTLTRWPVQEEVAAA